jgi:hypothetical protein
MYSRRTLIGVLGLLAGGALALGTNVCVGAPHRALVIGNDNYPEPYTLPSCVADATAFRDWLRTVGYGAADVIFLTDASKPKMLQGLEAIVATTRQQRQEQIVIFYSGHGMQLPTEDGSEADRLDECLVAIDQPGQQSPDQFCIRDKAIRRYLDQIAAGADQVVLVFDCCFSGGATKGPLATAPTRPKKFIPMPVTVTKGLVPKPNDHPGFKSVGLAPSANHALPPKGLVFFAASDEREPASAAGKNERLSPFTARFLKLVQREAAATDHVATLKNVHEQLVDSLRGIQTPQLQPEGTQATLSFYPDVFPRPVGIGWQQQVSAGGVVIGPLATATGWATCRGLRWRILLLEGASARGTPVSPTQVFRTGQRFRLEVEAHVCDLWIYLLNLGSRGEMAVLFPEQAEAHRQVKKHEKAVFPPGGDRFRFSEPPGKELFRIIASPVPLKWVNPKELLDLEAGQTLRASEKDLAEQQAAERSQAIAAINGRHAQVPSRSESIPALLAALRADPSLRERIDSVRLTPPAATSADSDDPEPSQETIVASKNADNRDPLIIDVELVHRP